MTQPRLRVTVADDDVWDGPSDQQIQRLFAGLNARRHFLVLERLDVPEGEVGQHYLQIALRDDLTLLLETRDGSAIAHHRAEVGVPSDQGGADLVVPVMLDWAAGRPGWRTALPWVHWDAERECPWGDRR
ncbi:hypothetical protein [Streptomyces sp. SID5643]|uniref:hypothetical protein n=1 Tax=Streptomyces sp. SID5643 TaxID=2690307 RepID=UPI00136CF8C4|nr:hypothetical protein [Streptomyces sp. SID5643]MZF83758.1 hypothetical protein [Streptomyces sp. SID5643]